MSQRSIRPAPSRRVWWRWFANGLAILAHRPNEPTLDVEVRRSPLADILELRIAVGPLRLTLGRFATRRTRRVRAAHCLGNEP